MKENRLTHGSNMRWETKYVLPEHRDGLLRQAEERRKRARKELDEQLLGEINLAIADSYQFRMPIKLRMYDLYEDITVEGVVDRVDPFKGRFMIDGEWFDVDDAEGVAA